jgi:hypothetical protein
MKFKREENELIWESFRSKQNINEKFDDMDDELLDTDDEYSDEGFDDEYGDEGFDDEFDDDLGGGTVDQNIVMELEPMGAVEPQEVNEVLVSELKKLAEYSKRLYDMRTSAEFEDWMVSAITIASTYMSDVWHRLDAKADFANTGFEQSDDFNQIS